MAQLRNQSFILGAANLGKSHLRQRLTKLNIPENYIPTLGTEVSPVDCLEMEIYYAQIFGIALETIDIPD